MKPLPHHYAVHLSGAPSGYAELSAPGLPPLRTAPPVDYDGIVDRTEGITRFTEILLQPTLTVPAGTNRDRVLQILHKAEQACLISASLSSRLRLEATVLDLDTVLNVGNGIEQPTRHGDGDVDGDGALASRKVRGRGHCASRRWSRAHCQPDHRGSGYES